jgi:type IV pilus assembly protein PilM
MLRSSSVIGLDIGSHQIKAVYVERRKQACHLVSAGAVPTPPGAVQEGIVQQPDAVAEALRGLCRQNDIPFTEAIAAISGATVTVRNIKVPNMNEASLKKSIRFEASKYVPSVQDSVVEYEMLGRSGDPPQLDVLLVAAPNDMVNSRVAAMEMAGLEPVAIDIEAFALLRVLQSANIPTDTSGAVALVNLGATFTDLNIVFQGQLVVTRSIPIGGHALTQSVASAANVDLDQAEELKRRLDVTWPAPEPSESRFLLDQELPGLRQAQQVVGPFLEEILREIRRSVNYFQSQMGGEDAEASVTRLVLTGGTAKLTGLASYLEAKLGVPVTMLDLFSAEPQLKSVVGVSSGERFRKLSIDLSIATGLALKE